MYYMYGCDGFNSITLNRQSKKSEAFEPSPWTSFHLFFPFHPTSFHVPWTFPIIKYIRGILWHGLPPDKPTEGGISSPARPGRFLQFIFLPLPPLPKLSTSTLLKLMYVHALKALCKYIRPMHYLSLLLVLFHPKWILFHYYIILKILKRSE